MTISIKIRSIEWIESRILEILSKVKNNKHPIYLCLSAMVLDFAVQSNEEQKNFDTALQNLIVRGLIRQEQDQKGFNIYKLAEQE